jgi:hypothetical protein
VRSTSIYISQFVLLILLVPDDGDKYRLPNVEVSLLYLGIPIGLQTILELVGDVTSTYVSVHHHKNKCHLRIEPGTSEYKPVALLSNELLGILARILVIIKNFGGYTRFLQIIAGVVL